MAWIPPTVKAVAQAKVLRENTHALVMSSTEIRRVVKDLQVAFPDGTLHAFAAKANALKGVLDVLNDAGMGCEVASFGEFAMARKCFPDAKIVFDSPCKTMDELRNSVYIPCYLNVDNFQELERVAQLNAEKPVVATIGVRINPQLGAGSIGCLSTALATSKFGIGLDDARDEIKAAFAKYPFLKMLHVHTGSQGIGLKMMTAGVKKITEFAEEIGSQVEIVDIGGGLPVNFASDEYTPTFAEYATKLREEVPVLFTGKYKLITEFGRAVTAKAGFLCSSVEYTKANGGRRIVQQHLGADMCIRTIWAPEQWPLRVDAFSGDGDLLTDDLALTDVAGPCCLGGDHICRERNLPLMNPGDIVIAKDTGGYYYSSFSIYNLRQRPPAFIFDEETGVLKQINKGQTLEDVLAAME